MPTNRYFYHSFPRPRPADTDQEKKGLRILECIVDFGLVLTPEAVRWEYPHADGSPPRTMNIAQRLSVWAVYTAGGVGIVRSEAGGYLMATEPFGNEGDLRVTGSLLVSLACLPFAPIFRVCGSPKLARA